MARGKWVVGLIAVIVVVGFYFWQVGRKSVNQGHPAIVTPESQVFPISTQTPTPTTAKLPGRPTAIPAGGNPEGEISCNYLTPPGPNSYGTAEIDSSWSNLAQATVCVAVNGQSENVVSIDNTGSGSRKTQITWLARNGSYGFGLHNGDCGATVMASCQITTH